MPLFDLICPKCQTTSPDVMLSIRVTSEELPICPDCEVRTEKLPSKAHAAFKGAGFHCRDYAAPTRN